MFIAEACKQAGFGAQNAANQVQPVPAGHKFQPANTEGVWFMGGLLTDEWKSGDTFVQRDETDKRTIALDNSIVTAGYQYIHRARISANQAIDLLRKYKPNPASGIAQMYFVRSYAELLSGEDLTAIDGILSSADAGAG